jgi:hypothetical protein
MRRGRPGSHSADPFSNFCLKIIDVFSRIEPPLFSLLAPGTTIQNGTTKCGNWGIEKMEPPTKPR